MKEWSAVMIERMKELKPLVACFNGKGIYEIFNGGKCTVGLQEQPLPGTETVSHREQGFVQVVWVVWGGETYCWVLYEVGCELIDFLYQRNFLF